MDHQLKILSEPAPGDAESCYVDSTLGIVSILKSLAAHKTQAAVYPDDGETYLQTSLLAVEVKPPGFFFETGSEAQTNQLALKAKQLTFITSEHGVRVQFTCATPEAVQRDGVSVFRAQLPERVLRLQRREYFRLDGTQVHSLLQCTLTRGDTSPGRLKPAVLDVSSGGLALALSSGEPPLEIGTRHTCALEIPLVGRTDVLVEVHTARNIVLPTGAAAMRYGVGFMNLDVRFSTLLQRYIIDEERARRARSQS
ncbi:MAG: flagellar brake protein [Pseudomonadota bacterium]